MQKPTTKLIRKIFSNLNVATLFAGQLISQIGDSMYNIALIWLALDLTGSKSATGTVAMISYLPMLVFALLAGALVDMFDRKRVMLISALLRAGAVLIIPLAFFVDHLSLAVIMGVSFLVASLSTVFNPARDSLLPNLTEGTNLIRANSIIQVSSHGAFLLGPMLAAILISVGGVVHLFTFDSLTFIVSLVAILLIRTQADPARRKLKKRTQLANHLREITHSLDSRMDR